LDVTVQTDLARPLSAANLSQLKKLWVVTVQGEQ